MLVSEKTVKNRFHEGPTSSSGTCASSPTPCSSIDICKETPELAGLPLVTCSPHRESRFTPTTCDRHGERYAACNINQHHQFGGGPVMVHGHMSFCTTVRQWAPDAGQYPVSSGQSVQAFPG